MNRRTIFHTRRLYKTPFISPYYFLILPAKVQDADNLDAPTPNPRSFPRDSVAGPSSIPQPDASPVRTTNHTRLLQMVQEAERQKQLVESMTDDDLDKFNDMIDTLSDIGKGAMRNRRNQLRRKKAGRK
jgi:hypothetical protein